MLESSNNLSKDSENRNDNNKDSTKIEKSLINRDDFLYKLNNSWIKRNSLIIK